MSVINKIIEKHKNSGFIELIFLAVSYVFIRVTSVMRIFFLRLRLFDIDYSVDIGKDVVFFQSVKKSIVVLSRARIGHGVRVKAGFKGKIRIGRNVLIDDYTYISSHESIEIGDETMIAASCYIVDFNHKIPLSKSKKNLSASAGYVSSPIKIGKYVWIGANVTILPSVSIGDNTVIGAGSVVTKSIPENCVAVGVPAKVIRKI